MSDRNNGNITLRDASVTDCTLNNRQDPFCVMTAGDLWHNTAILRVDVHLRRNDGREYPPRVFHDRCCGLIARGFDAENVRHAGFRENADGCDRIVMN